MRQARAPICSVNKSTPISASCHVPDVIPEFLAISPTSELRVGIGGVVKVMNVFGKGAIRNRKKPYASGFGGLFDLTVLRCLGRLSGGRDWSVRLRSGVGGFAAS